MKENKRKRWINHSLLCALVLSINTSFVLAQDKKWDRDKISGLYTYEQKTTFDNGPYAFDNHTWLYSQSFADFFYMPDKWVYPNWSHRQSIAFRYQRHDRWQCDDAQRTQGCKQLANCTLDILIEHDNPWPWPAGVNGSLK